MTHILLSILTSRASRLAFLFAFLTLAISACEIVETEGFEAGKGSVYVTSRTSGGEEITGAVISVDGVNRNQTTPDTVAGISVGRHSISVYKPGFVEVSDSVGVEEAIVASVEFELIPASDGAIVLQSAPEGTVLLLNGLPFGSPTPPVEFTDMGFGTFEVSAYLAGHATDLPSIWQVELSESNPLETLTPTFASVELGSEIGMLAPVFSLPGLPDSSLFTHSSLRGKVILVNFFFYNCAPCLIEFPDIQEVYEDPRFAGRIEFFAIDGNDPWQLFVRYLIDHPQLGLTFPLLHDLTQTVRANDFDVTACPANFLIDKTGVVRYRWGSVTRELLIESIQLLLSEGE